MLSPQLKAIAVSVGCVVGLCVMTSKNSVTSLKATGTAAQGGGGDLDPLMDEAEQSQDPVRGLISSVHTIATLTANRDTGNPLMQRAHRVRQGALAKLGY